MNRKRKENSAANVWVESVELSEDERQPVVSTRYHRGQTVATVTAIKPIILSLEHAGLVSNLIPHGHNTLREPTATVYFSHEGGFYNDMNLRAARGESHV